MKIRNIFAVAALVLSSPRPLNSMLPGGDEYMKTEWRRRSDSLFVEEIKKSDSQLPTWWAMPDPKKPDINSFGYNTGTRYVDPNTGRGYWDVSGFYRQQTGTYGKNTTNIPEIKIVPADSIYKDKGFEKVK